MFRGWKTISCWLREDLEELGEDAVEARFLEDNLNRRQLSKLAIARTYQRLKELHQDDWGSSHEACGDLRDHLGKRIGMSGRQLDRYVRMLDATIVVQQAFERGSLSQKQVLAFFRLYEEDQQAVVEAIEAGEDARQFIDEMPQCNPNQPWGIDRMLRSLNKAVRSVRNKLDGRMDEAGRCCSDPVRRHLEYGKWIIHLRRPDTMSGKHNR